MQSFKSLKASLCLVAVIASLAASFFLSSSNVEATFAINIWKHRYPFYGAYHGYGYPFYGGYGGYYGGGYGGIGIGLGGGGGYGYGRRR